MATDHAHGTEDRRTQHGRHAEHGSDGAHDHHGAAEHGNLAANDSGGRGGHEHRTHRFNPANLARLLGEERRSLLPPEATLRAAGVEAGQTVVDLGCGPGFFALPAAVLVGQTGRVYAVDVQPEMVAAVRQRAAEAGLQQVAALQSEEAHVPLPDGIADRVFVAFVLHEAEDQPALLGEARRLLKPGGEVAIVEWQKKDGPPGPPKAHRVALEDVAAVAAGAGLRVREHRALNEHHYLVRLAVG